ncbi:MAG: pyridoxamine 5'-phosphate oxidase family protein [Deltaproteobacteria bacterium]|nr:pyridoxamine 5'-phosphate oxidase family protein [Deltaproteobacteria bacterium]
MRRNDREIVDLALIEDIIRNSLVCRLGMSRNDQPYVVPLCFAYRDNTLYFHSAREGLKLEILQQNSKVCVEFDIDQEVIQGDKPCKWSMQYRSVIGFGRASLVEDSEEKKKGLDAIMKQYSDKSFEYVESAIESICIIKVEIESMTGKKSGY